MATTTTTQSRHRKQPPIVAAHQGQPGHPLSEETIRKVEWCRDHRGEALPWGSYTSGHSALCYLRKHSQRHGWPLVWEYQFNEDTGLMDIWATWPRRVRRAA
jgi:hypothetical protein